MTRRDVAIIIKSSQWAFASQSKMRDACVMVGKCPFGVIVPSPASSLARLVNDLEPANMSAIDPPMTASPNERSGGYGTDGRTGRAGETGPRLRYCLEANNYWSAHGHLCRENPIRQQKITGT
jgi:hypothetical protein